MKQNNKAEPKARVDYTKFSTRIYMPWLPAKGSQRRGVIEGSSGRVITLFKWTPCEIMLFIQGKDMLNDVVKKLDC